MQARIFFSQQAGRTLVLLKSREAENSCTRGRNISLLWEAGGSEVEQGPWCCDRAPSSSCIHPSPHLQASLTLLNSPVVLHQLQQRRRLQLRQPSLIHRGISRRSSPPVRPASSWSTPLSLFFPRAASSNNNTTLDILPILHWSDIWKMSSATAPWLHREQQVGLTTASSAQPSPSTSPPAAARPGKFPSLLAKIINWLLLHACVNHSCMRATVPAGSLVWTSDPTSFWSFETRLHKQINDKKRKQKK